MPRILSSTLLLLLLVAAPTSAKPPQRPKAPKPPAVDLVRLVRTISSVRSSALTVARAFGVTAKRAAALVPRSEPIDTRYPALSLPGDLPKADYPNRAAVARPVRLFGKKATARVLSELRTIKDRTRRAALLGNRKARIVVMLMLEGIKRPAQAVALARVERLLRKLGARTLGSGRLGVCGKAGPWCYTRALLIDAHKGHYRVRAPRAVAPGAQQGRARARHQARTLALGPAHLPTSERVDDAAREL
ncbi:MAG: hypothetical protein KC503_07030, partial [Myxococcales bacterium]|nr:hypothetical protein [Myxococcales bacterium]